MSDEYDYEPAPARFPCTMCGSRNWPTKDTSCPLCYDETEEEQEDD